MVLYNLLYASYFWAVDSVFGLLCFFNSFAAFVMTETKIVSVLTIFFFRFTMKSCFWVLSAIRLNQFWKISNEFYSYCTATKTALSPLRTVYDTYNNQLLWAIKINIDKSTARHRVEIIGILFDQPCQFTKLTKIIRKYTYCTACSHTKYSSTTPNIIRNRQQWLGNDHCSSIKLSHFPVTNASLYSRIIVYYNINHP